MQSPKSRKVQTQNYSIKPSNDESPVTVWPGLFLQSLFFSGHVLETARPMDTSLLAFWRMALKAEAVIFASKRCKIHVFLHKFKGRLLHTIHRLDKRLSVFSKNMLTSFFVSYKICMYPYRSLKRIEALPNGVSTFLMRLLFSKQFS